MITLGQASNYRGRQVWRHLLAWGTAQDSAKLRLALAQRYGAGPEQVALYHTGRSALTVTLQALAPEGAWVIIPGLTCIAVVRAVKAAGCEPVFVDLKAGGLEYNYEKLEKALDKSDNLCYNRSIILVQNTLGISWQVSKIERLAKKYHAEIVEDLAHSAGRFYADGREVGTVGSATALSFGKGKAIDTISGGAAIIRKPVTKPRRSGKPDSSNINSSAAVAASQLVQPIRRPRLADRWRDRWYPVFGGLARATWRCGLGKLFIGGLVKIHWVQRSADAELDISRRLTHWQAKLALQQLQQLPTTPLREYCLVKNRTQALAELSQHGYCFEEIWYDTPVSPARYAKEAEFPTVQCPETVRISKQIINLPTWYPAEKLQTARTILEKYEEKI